MVFGPAVVWARTDEPETRVGQFLVPAGLPGTRVVETWDHLGLRASGSHDIIFDDVVFPLDHEIDTYPLVGPHRQDVGRVVADVYVNNQNVADTLTQEGYAKPR